jgi:two-component system, LytTR family, response regulator
MNAIIVEDTPGSYESLKLKLNAFCPHVQILAWAKSCSEAVAKITQHKPDLLFLDIELPDGKGFDILEKIHPLRPSVIFVTGYNEHISRGFQFSAIDYLLKPVEEDKLAEAVARAEERNRINLMAEQYAIFEQSNKDALQRRIALSNQEMIIYRSLDDIVFLEAGSHKTHFYFKDYYIEVSKKLSDYEDLFRPYPFLMKVLRSYIANINEVRHYIRTDSALLMSNGKTVGLGENYKQEMLARLRIACEDENSEAPRIELADQRIIAFPYLADVLYLKAENTMTSFYIKGYSRSFLVSKHIGTFADQLKSRPEFMKVQRSYIVNLAEVKVFNQSNSQVVLSNQEMVPVSKDNKDEFLARWQGRS